MTPPQRTGLSGTCLCLIFSLCVWWPPPGAGGCLRGVPVLRAGMGLVLLQPPADGPSLRPAVPPAQRGRRVPGPHAHLDPTWTNRRLFGAQSFIKGKVWAREGAETSGPPPAGGAGREPEKDDQEETPVGPWAEGSGEWLCLKTKGYLLYPAHLLSFYLLSHISVIFVIPFFSGISRGKAKKIKIEINSSEFPLLQGKPAQADMSKLVTVWAGLNIFWRI